jgi:phosphoglycolate phosphatase-like HAD superfamily hydrolase
MLVRTGSETVVRRRSTLPALQLLRRLRDPWPPLSGLLLDCGGVLYDDTVWLRWLLKLLTRLGLHTHFTPFMRVWQREYLMGVKTGDWEYWQALRVFLRAVGLSAGQIAEVQAAGMARQRDLEGNILPLPGVVHVLTRLHEQGIRLSVLSSSHMDAAGVQEQLSRLGLSWAFDRVLAEVDIAAAFPQRPALDVAISLIDLPVKQLAYVGRDTRLLAQANRAGVRTVAVNYDADAEADIYVDNFEQLLELLPWSSPHAMAG